jgi:hypothetical protein
VCAAAVAAVLLLQLLVAGVLMSVLRSLVLLLAFAMLMLLHS